MADFETPAKEHGISTEAYKHLWMNHFHTEGVVEKEGQYITVGITLVTFEEALEAIKLERKAK